MGEGTALLPPAGGGWKGGKPGFPLPLQMRAGDPRTHPPARGRVRAQPSSRGGGKPGFPLSLQMRAGGPRTHAPTRWEGVGGRSPPTK